MAQTSGVAVPSGEIEQDVPCCRCGYNLRGLRRSGLCPECGIAVAASFAALPAERVAVPSPEADPRPTSRLGWAIVCLGMLPMVLSAPTTSMNLSWLTTAVGATTVGIYLVGTILLAQTTPQILHQAGRRWVTIGLYVSIGLLLVRWSLDLATSSGMIRITVGTRLTYWIVLSLVVLSYPPIVWFSYAALRQVAFSVRNDDLARSLAFAGWLLAAVQFTTMAVLLSRAFDWLSTSGVMWEWKNAIRQALLAGDMACAAFAVLLLGRIWQATERRLMA